MAKGWKSPPDHDPARFINWLVWERERRGWSQTKLVRMAGINAGSFSGALQGKRLLSPLERQQLVEALTEHGTREPLLRWHDLARIAGLPDAAIVPVQHEAHASRYLDETVAEAHARVGRWILAGDAWRSASKTAEREGDWPRWARCLLGASTMAHHRGDITAARNDLVRVLDAARQGRLIGEEARIEALVRLGWGEYREGQLIASRNHLADALARLGRWNPPAPEMYRLVIHQHVHYCDGPEARFQLLHLASYNYGRTLIEMAIKRTTDEEIRRTVPSSREYFTAGLDYLDRAERIEHVFLNRGRDLSNDWLTLLRRVTPLQRLDRGREARRCIAEARELAKPYVTGPARVDYEAAKFLTNDSPTRARTALVNARAEFAGPPFYAPGIADVLHEDLQVKWQAVTDQGGSVTGAMLEQAFAAIALHPYGDNLILYHDVMTAYLERTDPRLARKHLRDIEERAALRDGEHFAELGLLQRTLGEAAWAHHQTIVHDHAHAAITNALAR